MRGRRPQPEGIKSQKAPVRSTRKAAPAAVAVAGGIQPPAWLKAEGLGIWNRLAPTLSQAKLLTAADTETFARYCRNFARWLAMQRALDEGSETYTVETAAGVVHRARPEFLIADRLERMMMATEDRFGLNPAERQRIIAARAQTGVSGDLFDAIKPKAGRPDDVATQAAPAAQPIGVPIGFLN